MISTIRSVLLSLLLASTTITNVAGFVTKSVLVSVPAMRNTGALQGATTIEPPTREKTDVNKKNKKKSGNNNNEEDGTIDDFGADETEYPDLEYLIDASESREIEDPFHILLMGATFEAPKITVPYVSSSLCYVLGMPNDEAKELSKFAYEHGMSCLGTWKREECLKYGRQLQVRDVRCRVVPYCEGGQRGWQAKDASGSTSSNSNSNADAFS